MELRPSLLASGLIFPEGPRWAMGRLWISDIYGQKVVTCTPAGEITTVLDAPSLPSGLGFLPDGSLVVATMLDGRLLRWADGDLSTLADVSSYGNGDQFWDSMINDMVIDGRGNVYVGIYGLGPDQSETGILLRRMDGSIDIVASGLAIANGMIVTPDRATLIVAELGSDHLTAFDVAEDGSLSGRRVFAQVSGMTPDGICLDASGAVWVGSVYQGEFLRIAEGGRILDRVEVGRYAIAPALGGPDRSTLYLMTADSTRDRETKKDSRGYVQVVSRVDVPGAGWP